jgi:eukaryotic-like serine/threonine-protein kinase
MDATRWALVQTIFHQAAELPSDDERSAYLQRACHGDPTLIADVKGLLQADAEDAGLLDRGVDDVAQAFWLSDAPDRPAFTHIGRYRILRTLGEGGMGVVYLAERQDLGALVAIKVLRDAALSPERRARFRVEQRTLARLTHDGIARLHDADMLPDGTPWFAMEYVEGATLDAYCRREQPALSRRLALFRHVCEAVQYAHQRLVVHRDLKPSNILVTADGRVKLVDFGIAKHLDHADAPADQTRTAFRLMTPAYAAPEQIRGDPVGLHTDVYALGAIFYGLLAGCHPFDLANKTPHEAERIVLEHVPERPSVARRAGAAATGLPGATASKAAWADLDVLCLTAMHKDPERRYATVEALIRDLDHFRQGEPLEARKDSLGYRTRKFTRRHWRMLTAAAALVLSVTATAAVYTYRLSAAHDAAVTEAARTQRVQQFMLGLFDAGETDEAPAADLRVLTLLDRGVRSAKALDAQPLIQADLHQTLGNVYGRLGQYSRAEELLQSSLDSRRALRGTQHPDVAESLVELGLLRLSQAKLADAARLVGDGLGLAYATLPPAHPLVARATLARGKVLEAQGVYDKAIPVLEQAVRLSGGCATTTETAIERATADARPASSNGGALPPSTSATPELAAAMTALANAHFYAGHHDRAEALNRQILEISRRLHGDRHPTVAHDLINLGATEYERGAYQEAERYRRGALDIFREWYGDDHKETASAKTLLAQAYIAQRRFDEALPLLRQALATQERVYGVSHPRVALVLNSLGSVAQQQGRLDDAEVAFLRTVTIYRATYPDGRHMRIGVAQANLAGVYLLRQDYARAERIFREALALFTDVLGEDHQQSGIARIKLGRALLRQRRHAEAEPLLHRGYLTLMKSMKPGVTWLQTAREDLAEVYEAQQQPAKARMYRDEHASFATTAGSAASTTRASTTRRE